jgi:hypothetical protein
MPGDVTLNDAAAVRLVSANEANTVDVTSDGALRVVTAAAPLPAGQTAIRRFATVSSTASTYTTITNATGVPAGGYPAQNATYTVPVGKTLEITALSLRRLSAKGNNASGGIAAALVVGSAIVAIVSTVDVSADVETFEPPLGPFAAGTVIGLRHLRIGSDTVIGHVAWQGVEK